MSSEKGNIKQTDSKSSNKNRKAKGAQLQEKFENSNQDFNDWQQTFDAIPFFLALLTPDFDFIRLNRAGSECFGKKFEEVRGKRCCEIIHGQNTPVDGCPCLKSIRTKRAEFSEIIVKGKCYLSAAFPVLDHQGEVRALVHTLRDIAERQQKEEELGKYHDRLEELVKERTLELSSINKRLQSEILERKQAEEEIKRSYHTQSVLNELLHISLEVSTLEEMLEKIIHHIFSIPWLALESQGGIFLVEDEPEVLILKAQRGMSKSLQGICARVPFGRCLCGRVAKSGEIQFADRIDDRHESRYKGMSAHGHYCIPILTSEKKVLGVITLYLKPGHRRDEKEEKFLSAVADVLTGIIERRRAEERIMETAEQLKIERGALERKNIALREVLDQFEAEKNKLKRQFLTNVEQAIIPTLLRLKKSSRPFQKPIFEMLEKDLKEIVSPFLATLQHNHTRLSPREMEVCRLIKNGMTSKEIAEALNLSLLTVYKYRELIRKKLRLVNDDTNLQSYLLSI